MLETGTSKDRAQGEHILYKNTNGATRASTGSAVAVQIVKGNSYASTSTPI